METILVNKLPTRTWNRLGVNETALLWDEAGAVDGGTEVLSADGRLELSNNRAERSVRPFAIGRKNWLFSNTPLGAKISAVIYSLVETAKINGLNPASYLEYLLTALPRGNQPEDCLPWLPGHCSGRPGADTSGRPP